MSKYLLYKPKKNCAEMPNGCQNIAFSLGDAFLAHPVYIYIYIIYRDIYMLYNIYIYIYTAYVIKIVHTVYISK